MEGFTQPANDNETAPTNYDREAIAAEAMSAANRLLTERGIDGQYGDEKFDAMVSLMEELSNDNNNRHVVEALARRLTVEKADHIAWVTSEQYPEVKAA